MMIQNGLMSKSMADSSKKNEVYDSVRKAIISSELAQGTIINENEVAKQFSVSRTPVREALLMLAHEGLVKPLPRAGYMVTQISIRDVQEAFHLREILEVEAARLAAERITPEEIKDLEARKIGIPGNINPAFNHEFHLIIARASGNSRIASLVQQLLDEMERILIFDPYITNPPPDVSEHDDIVTALCKGDAGAAQDAMRRHLQAVKSRVLQRF